MVDNDNQKVVCPICGIQRMDKNPYCPDCGFSYSSFKLLRITDILSDESGMCDACAPTGCTCGQTPGPYGPKPKTVPATKPRQKPEPVQKEEPRIVRQPKQELRLEPVQEESRQEPTPESHNICCSVCVRGPLHCIGSFFKGVYRLFKFLLILGLGFAFIYFFLFWLQHQ